MKKIILFIAIALNYCSYAQDEKTVTINVNGQGQTLEEARQNALRNAIEEAFGVFISSNTKILNDELVKDEIVSVSNGNIQSFDIISETEISENNYMSSLRATVSINKLTSFVESKGFEVEFKGGLFTQNIKMQQLYEKNESIAVKNMIKVLKEISNESFDFEIRADEPISSSTNHWEVPIRVDIKMNENFFKVSSLLFGLLNDLKMTYSEMQSYMDLKKPFYPITFIKNENEKGIFFFRNSETNELILDFIYSLNNIMTNFRVDNGIEMFYMEYCKKHGLLRDAFRPILMYDGYDNYLPSLFGKRRSSYYSMFSYRDQIPENWKVSLKGLYIRNPSFDEWANVFLDKKSAFYIGDLLSSSNATWGDKSSKFYYHDPRPTKSKKKSEYVINKDLGLVISFLGYQKVGYYTSFSFKDNRTLDELNKINKYKIVKNTPGVFLKNLDELKKLNEFLDFKNNEGVLYKKHFPGAFLDKKLKKQLYPNEYKSIPNEWRYTYDPSVVVVGSNDAGFNIDKWVNTGYLGEYGR